DATPGEIKGNVTDANGNRIRGVTVYAVPQDISFDTLTPRSTTTNDSGDFDFRGGFALGSYKLYTRKKADGSPDATDKFYTKQNLEFPKVELTQEHPSASVTLALGDKAAVLAGRLIDANTGKPLKGKLVFLDEDGNSHSVFVTGKYRTLLPAGKD